MIKVKSIRTYLNNQVDVSLFSDTKAEVRTTPLSDIEGFPQGCIIAMGSSILTAEGELAFMKSDGQWQWQ